LTIEDKRVEHITAAGQRWAVLFGFSGRRRGRGEKWRIITIPPLPFLVPYWLVY